MEINITLNHLDIVGVNANKFCAAMYVLQGLAKSNRLTGDLAPFATPPENYPEQQSYTNTAVAKAAEKPVIEIDRKQIEAEIKQIAANGREENKSEKIRDIIHLWGFSKMSDIPDAQMPEFLEKVKAL